MPNKTRQIAKRRNMILTAYWTWLAAELLIPEPWMLFGDRIAHDPPIEVHSTVMSLVIHCGSFLVLAMLIGWAKAFVPSFQRLKWYGSAVAFGFLTEFIQQWIPKRWAGLDDALANSMGVGLGAYLIYRIYLKRRSSPTTHIPLDSSAEKSYIMDGSFDVKKSA